MTINEMNSLLELDIFYEINRAESANSGFKTELKILKLSDVTGLKLGRLLCDDIKSNANHF